MKDKILKILDSKIRGAEENLYRAKMQCRDADLGSEYGQSGRTCGDILQGYYDELDELVEMRSWLRSV